MGTSPQDVVDVGFAKLKGLDFEFYMQAYSILLGQNSKNSAVDIDLCSLGGGSDIARKHARIFYDFEQHHFVLEILGRKGCVVQGILHLPGGPPVKLNSQDHIRIGRLEFYFLLPSKGIPFHPKHCSVATTTTTSKGEGVVGVDTIDVTSASKQLHCEKENEKEKENYKSQKEESAENGNNDAK